MTIHPTLVVYVIDDDLSVRQSLSRLMRSAGFSAQCFASVDDFIGHADFNAPACVVADVCLPGKSGLELPAKLAAMGAHMRLIFVTANDTPETRLAAQQAGAVAYFRKPVDDQALVDAILWGFARRPPEPARDDS